MSNERPLGGASAVSGLSDAFAQGAAYLSPFAQSAQAGASSSAAGLNEATRHLIDAAPHLFKPRMLTAALHSSTFVGGSGSSGTSGDRARIVGWGGLPLALSRPLSLSQPARSLARFGAAVASGGGLSAAELRAREDCAVILREAEAEVVERAQGLAIEDAATAAAVAASSTDADEPVSLLRGYEATRPSSLAGRAKRREARGKAVDAPRLGLKAMGENARGLLAAPSASSPELQDTTLGLEEAAVSFQSRTQGRASLRASRDAVIKLDESQLVLQKQEIEKEQQDVGVRRVSLERVCARCRQGEQERAGSRRARHVAGPWHGVHCCSSDSNSACAAMVTPPLFSFQALIRKEIAVVESKMAALATVRDRLEHSLLQLREEELELQDEGELPWLVARAEKGQIGESLPDHNPPASCSLLPASRSGWSLRDAQRTSA